jgi:hypothetical protein
LIVPILLAVVVAYSWRPFQLERIAIRSARRVIVVHRPRR